MNEKERPRIGRGRIFFAGVLLVLLVTTGILGNRVFRERRGPAGTTVVSGDEPAGVAFRTLTLYFGSRDSTGLAAERRDVLAGTHMSQDVVEALEGLAEGPMTDLVPLLPSGTHVKHVFIDAAGLAYVDFSSEIVDGFRGAGLSRELLAVRSMALTLRVNFSALQALQILVDGRPVPTLGGHLDTSGPLALSEWD